MFLFKFKFPLTFRRRNVQVSLQNREKNGVASIIWSRTKNKWIFSGANRRVCVVNNAGAKRWVRSQQKTRKEGRPQPYERSPRTGDGQSALGARPTPFRSQCHCELSIVCWRKVSFDSCGRLCKATVSLFRCAPPHTTPVRRDPLKPNDVLAIPIR